MPLVDPKLLLSDLVDYNPVFGVIQSVAPGKTLAKCKISKDTTQKFGPTYVDFVPRPSGLQKHVLVMGLVTGTGVDLLPPPCWTI